MGSIDRPNFDLLKGFFDSSSDEENNDKIKSFIEATRANRDVRVWYKQCIPRKLCTLALTLKGYLGIWYFCVTLLAWKDECFEKRCVMCLRNDTSKTESFFTSCKFEYGRVLKNTTPI